MRVALETRDYSPHTQLAVRTTRSEVDAAELIVSGYLDAESAPALVCVVDGHLLVRHRFLRVDVSGLRVTDAEGLDMLLDLHRRVLAARGTLILTGVPDVVRAAIDAAGLGQILFLVAPTAAEMRAKHGAVSDPVRGIQPLGQGPARTSPACDGESTRPC